MSIAEQITRISNNISSAYDEAETKGATMPSVKNSDNLPTTIASITGGGGSSIVNQNEAGISPLYVWNGTEAEWDVGGVKTWYNWESSEIRGNYTIVGSPIISDDFIASGFTVSSYLNVSSVYDFYTDLLTATNWEVTLKYHHVSTGVRQKIFATDNDTNNNSWIGVEDNNVWRLRLKHDSTFIFDFTGSTVISSDTTYYLKVGFTGSKYYLKYSTDNINWSTEGETSSTEVVNAGTLWYLGASSGSNIENPISGSLDLKECYITIDGKESWRGASNLKVYTDITSPTTESKVYDEPNVESTLTIADVGETDIVLSDGNVYDRNESGDTTTTQSVGEAHPDYISFIDGVGVKVGTTDIADL